MPKKIMIDLDRITRVHKDLLKSINKENLTSIELHLLINILREAENISLKKSKTIREIQEKTAKYIG